MKEFLMIFAVVMMLIGITKLSLVCTVKFRKRKEL